MGYLSCKAETSIATAHDDNKSSSPETDKQNPIKLQQFNYSDLELATSNFSRSKLLGRGSHGLVYKGVLRGGRLVAVKKPSRAAAQSPNEAENELDILSNLRSPRLVNLRSPRLVNLVGFTSNDCPHDRLLVVEFMSNGTLYDVLHLNPRAPNWGRRIKLAHQTAKAVHALHSSTPPVIHRDIKSANVLIDRNFNARLGDFGLALRCVDEFRLKSTPPAGTMGYLDPCYLTPDNLSTKTDVFSFGILLLEIISGRKAIDVAHSPPSILDWAVPLIRRGKLLSVYDPRVLPPKDASVRKVLAVVAVKCVRPCRERRPSMEQVAGCLGELSKLVPINPWKGIGRNPCLMVESVGRPVPSRAGGNGSVVCSRIGGRTLGYKRRVYSDLGLRSNLMELMSGPNGETVFRAGDDDDDDTKHSS